MYEFYKLITNFSGFFFSQTKNHTALGLKKAKLSLIVCRYVIQKTTIQF